LLDAGGFHSCGVLGAGDARCWGAGDQGQLGYASTSAVGDDETPAAAGPVSVGAGRTVRAVATGDFHTCAVLDDASVRCWGFGGDGRLGYANTNNVTDPGAAGPVDLGGPAVAISAGAAHTCAILVGGSVRCWGFGGGDFPMDGRLGYGDTRNIGDTETPGSVGPVKLGAGRTALAISAGREHTCVLLDDRTIKCWGRNNSGQLGYGNRTWLGDSPTTTPDRIAPVELPATARAISAGGAHTCVLLGDASVRCWGEAVNGQLGYANTEDIGDDETPATVGAVSVGGAAAAISAGEAHTCAVLQDGGVRCWGLAGSGRLGYPDVDAFGNQNPVGDNETPASVGPVDVGAGRAATAISAGREHTCARLDYTSVRCWGRGSFGRLGYCNQESIGDNEPPGSAGPVNLQPGDNGARCPGSEVIPPAGDPPAATPDSGAGPIAPSAGGGSAAGPAPPPATDGAPSPSGDVTSPARPVNRLALALAAQAKRAQALRRCRAAAARRPKRLRRAAVGLCLKRHARTPGRATALKAAASSRTKITLTFAAPGSDASTPPAARAYLVKQSLRPIRDARDFGRAQTLCKGACRFTVTAVGAKVTLAIGQLRAHTTYYYAIAARDNVTGRLGPRSQTARARTRRSPPAIRR